MTRDRKACSEYDVTSRIGDTEMLFYTCCISVAVAQQHSTSSLDLSQPLTSDLAVRVTSGSGNPYNSLQEMDDLALPA